MNKNASIFNFSSFAIQDNELSDKSRKTNTLRHYMAYLTLIIWHKLKNDLQIFLISSCLLTNIED